jgi:high affinity Mn2+ porin
MIKVRIANLRFSLVRLGLAFGWAVASARAGDPPGSAVAGTGNAAAPTDSEPNPKPAPDQEQAWNWHVQNTVIVQGYPGFSASYSGPNSLRPGGEVRETVSLDLQAGVRLWRGAEAHVDGLMWQGFGLGKTLGVEAFPNGEGFRLGTTVPNITFARLFLRQTFGLGGEQEAIEDGPLQLGGKADVSRLTLTIGKISAKDIFDNNAYANDSRTQFMSWALMANEAWDYPADSLGFMTGLAAELNQPNWAVRFGFFQMPRTSNGMALDTHYLEAWGMVLEFERRYVLKAHQGTVRLLTFLNQADMGSYQAALDSPTRPADIVSTRAYRHKYGFGLNVEQELAKNVGVFMRLGWSDGLNEAWTFADVDRTATAGVSVKGELWHRPNDTFGLANALTGIARAHQEFLAAGGTGILAGDGALSYALEESIETYYDFQVWKTIRFALDYQLVVNPAYNHDRGPVSVFGARVRWEF